MTATDPIAFYIILPDSDRFICIPAQITSGDRTMTFDLLSLRSNELELATWEKVEWVCARKLLKFFHFSQKSKHESSNNNNNVGL